MKTKRHTKNQAKANILERDRAPLIEHLHELKRRLFYVAVSIAVGSALAYAVEQHLINALLRPSKGQHFIYTSPMGGINFLFSVCIYVGVALSLPIIVYNFLQFVRPLMRDTTARFIFIASGVSGCIALGGLAFGYFIGLPAALTLLLHQFHSSQIQALITIQSYMAFVTAYLFGSALMFQLPLFLVFINRIKPLKPSQLFKYERLVVIFSVIVGFIMNPSPNLISQGMVIIPIILMYQVGILLVWFINRGGHGEKFSQLLSEDAIRQAERTQQAAQLLPVLTFQAEEELARPKRFLELSEDNLLKPTASEAKVPESKPELETRLPETALASAATATAGRVRPRHYDIVPTSLASQMQSAQSSTASSYQSISVHTTD
jgi:sec-independent protein translocase protein TatC